MATLLDVLARYSWHRLERRITALEHRLDALERRLDALEHRHEVTQ